jgi:hypothetical protein
MRLLRLLRLPPRTHARGDVLHRRQIMYLTVQ